MIACGLSKEDFTILDAINQRGEVGWCFTFKHLMRETGLAREVVRDSCRFLTDIGFAQYSPGLFDDDGMVAGAGYGPTYDGLRFA